MQRRHLLLTGLALLGSGLLLWLLLNYTRIMTIMKRAADRPVGYVGSAVMLNARLKQGMPLLDVLALTRALGELARDWKGRPVTLPAATPAGSEAAGKWRDRLDERFVLERMRGTGEAKGDE